MTDNPSGPSRQALYQAIREMETAMVCALARRLRRATNDAAVAAWVSELGVEGAIRQVEATPRSLISRVFNFFGAR